MSIRVLVVDDHPIMRDGLAALLRAAGMEVVGAAADGRSAVRLARELRPDVCLTDLSMPGLNGIEAARKMRERVPGMQVVLLSMHSTREHVFQAFKAGALGYVLKDSAADEVVAAVRAAHAGRRFTSAALGGIAADAGLRGPLDSLSSRERQVLQLVVEGKSSAEIAAIVHLSGKTVQTYRSRLMAKLGVTDVPALVKFALRHGLTPPA